MFGTLPFYFDSLFRCALVVVLVVGTCICKGDAVVSSALVVVVVVMCSDKEEVVAAATSWEVVEMGSNNLQWFLMAK